MAAPQQGFPNVNAPFVDSGGFIQLSWFRLLQSLWSRTGGGAGTTGSFTTGDIKESAVPGAQPGWLVCDGSAVSRSTYADLFSKISTIYGPGDGSTTFNIPDYRGKFRIGTSGTFPLGSTGGSLTQSLAVNNLALHTHTVIDPHHTHVFTANPHAHTLTDPSHFHTVNDPTHVHGHDIGSRYGSTAASAADSLANVSGGPLTGPTGPTTISISAASTGISLNSSFTNISVNNFTVTGTNASVGTGISLGNTGNGDPFSIMPPYTPVTVLIKT